MAGSSVHGPGFETGRGGGFFPVGRETPMLISRKPNPFRNSANSFIGGFLPCADSNFTHTAMAGEYGHFFAGCSLRSGAAGEVSPFRMATAACGSGLSALASRTLTCHIWVSVRTSLYAGMPVKRMPLATFQ